MHLETRFVYAKRKKKIGSGIWAYSSLLLSGCFELSQLLHVLQRRVVWHHYLWVSKTPVYINKRVAVKAECDSSSIWTSIMIPCAREFLQCYNRACHLWWVNANIWRNPSCVSPRPFRFYLVFGGWGCWTNLTNFFLKYPLLCNCRWLLVPFYECFCRMWTCCTSSGLELKIRKVSIDL